MIRVSTVNLPDQVLHATYRQVDREALWWGLLPGGMRWWVDWDANGCRLNFRHLHFVSTGEWSDVINRYAEREGCGTSACFSKRSSTSR